MTVKKGGSDNVRKLNFKECPMLSSHDCQKVSIHFGHTVITCPTEAELKKYNSLNKKELSDYLKQNNYDLDKALDFALIEDGCDVLHVIYLG